MVFTASDSFTEKFVVSEKTYNGFIDLFGDRNALHTNDFFAKEKKFDGKVMHGNILNGFLSYFIGMCLPLKEVVIHTQEITFKKPVYLNDTLLLTATVTDVHESVNAASFSFDFKNASDQVVAKGKFQIGLLL